MARYYMHLRNGIDDLLDPDGREFPNLAALRQAVLSGARDILAGDARDGLIDLRYRIDAEDEGGEIVYTLRLRDAVNIITDDTALPSEAP